MCLCVPNVTISSESPKAHSALMIYIILHILHYMHPLLSLHSQLLRWFCKRWRFLNVLQSRESCEGQGFRDLKFDCFEYVRFWLLTLCPMCKALGKQNERLHSTDVH